MDGLNVLTSGLQKGRKGCFWEFLGCHVVLIPFEELPSLSGLVQAVIQSPRLLFLKVDRGNLIMAGVAIDDG